MIFDTMIYYREQPVATRKTHKKKAKQYSSVSSSVDTVASQNELAMHICIVFAHALI